MQHPTLTLIIRYPNDTLHLATQDHLKSKIIIKCQNCDQIQISSKNMKDATCKECGHKIKIQVVKGQNCRKANCNGELRLMQLVNGMMIQQCQSCDYRSILNIH